MSLAAVLSPAFAVLARRMGLVVAPRPDRWHSVATPLLGGAAICIAALATIGTLLDQPTAFLLVGCGLVAFAFGLVDDFRHLTPTGKLVGQVVVASLIFVAGIKAAISGNPAIDFVLTVTWVVMIMNAVNLMDNMDGLAAGVAAIAGIALAVTAPRESPGATLVAVATAGAAVGFLVHNFSPARVFMGDAGSNLLGLLLAAAALMHTNVGATNVGITVLAPVVVLALPIFDTALVTTARRLAGRPIGRGGRDHTSHRLAALGLSDRQTVLVLYLIAGTLAAVALAADVAALVFLPLAGLAIIGLVLFGLFLAEVDVYGQPDARTVPRSPIANALAVYGRFGVEVGLDVVLLTTAYFIVYVLRFEGQPESAWINNFGLSLPFVVGCQLAALLLTGVYRTLWRFVGLSDALRILRATAMGTGGAALLLLLGFRFEGLSRAVFVLHWLLATALLMGSRGFLLALRQWSALRPRQGARRALIVGATDVGAAALVLIGQREEREVRPVGFLDDDIGMRHRSIGGVPVLGRTSDLEEIARRLRIDLVVLAVNRGTHAASGLRASCDDLGIEWREVVISGSGLSHRADAETRPKVVGSD